MKGLYLVEPVVALYAFSTYLTYPLVQQYVYRRLWQQLTNSTYPVSDNTSTCARANASDHDNRTFYLQEVQEQVSLFSLYSQVLSAVPSLLVTLLLVAYSDRAGRKVAIVLPLVGTLLYTLSLLAVSYFHLNVYLLVGATFLSALFGGLGTFLGSCFAYVADLSGAGGQRMTLRIAGLDMMIGLLSGAASLCTGYFLRAAGFDGPFLTSAVCQVLVLLYAVFILEETVTRPDADPDEGSAVRQMFSTVYWMFTRAGPKQRMLLVLLVFIFTSFSFTYVGSFSLLVLYELNEPLCWTEILIGYGAALSTTIFLFSFAGVAAFTYCGAPQLLVVLIGILSLATGMTMVAFSKTTLMIFLARLPMLLSIMPFSVLRSMMSKIIRKSEQGALFALLSFAEVLTANVSAAVFNTLYAATVAWYPGFVFLVSAGLCVIPTMLLGVVCALGADVAAEDEAAVLVGESEERP
ncbi:lysosomal proton-coupled steroid conjugate and bile acid symporter SLC46A3 [Syngnathoides biaculeatus]|uniref:lysosomal proton-coupled steroid conjugate and bile acid symporter SLC46A3 n=1 Tax=Syngnathoides biaculeatus TaxID=300417 RepID=UPI002ADD9220|nr:lysosomal proton-coupled steroid conjugate and bile acid symporter SLC46A3 [Syngnathoides biaculeatus]